MIIEKMANYNTRKPYEMISDDDKYALVGIKEDGMRFIIGDFASHEKELVIEAKNINELKGDKK